MKKNESIQLVNYIKEEKIYTFNKKALQQIIEENGVQDLPVSVISVAGLFRKGKSFLLNFFLRYLYAEDRKHWISDSSESLKGFDWRGGSERNTEGIHIWSKIFKLQTADGSQVAVILMDTQGTFDGKSSNKTGTIIFALSALVTSVQVYNLSQDINEDDLENLLWFTQYATFALEETEEKALQSLIFLVRDWQCYQELPYGEEGGKMLLDEKFEITPGQEPSLTKVRNDIRSIFEKLSCFLLPHPGKTVATDMNFNGNIKDIDDEFITHIRDFVPSVLSPNNLVKKNVAGLGNVTGNEFIRLCATYLKYYNSDELPDERSKAEAAAEAYYALLVERCVNVYKTEMMKMLDGYLNRIEDCTSQVFKKAHEEMRAMAKNKFTKSKRFNKRISSIKLRDINTRIEELFVTLGKRRSEIYKSSATKYYNALANGVVKEYNNKMIAILDKSEDEIELYTPTAYAESHEKYKFMAIEKFGEEKRFCEFDVTEFLEKLKEDIDDSYEINESRRKPKFEPAVCSYYNHLIEKCFGEYNKEMRKLIVEVEAQLEKDQFEHEHEKYKSVAITEFNKSKCYIADIKSQYEEKLQGKIKAAYIKDHDKLRSHKIKYDQERLKKEMEANFAAAKRKHKLEEERLKLEAEERKKKAKADNEKRRLLENERRRREENRKIKDEIEQLRLQLEVNRIAKVNERQREREEKEKQIEEERRRRKEELEQIELEIQQRKHELEQQRLQWIHNY